MDVDRLRISLQRDGTAGNHAARGILGWRIADRRSDSRAAQRRVRASLTRGGVLTGASVEASEAATVRAVEGTAKRPAAREARHRLPHRVGNTGYFLCSISIGTLRETISLGSGILSSSTPLLYEALI